MLNDNDKEKLKEEKEEKEAIILHHIKQYSVFQLPFYA